MTVVCPKFHSESAEVDSAVTRLASLAAYCVKRRPPSCEIAFAVWASSSVSPSYCLLFEFERLVDPGSLPSNSLVGPTTWAHKSAFLATFRRAKICLVTLTSRNSWGLFMGEVLLF